MNRRQCLRAIGAGSLATLAGCGSSGNDDVVLPEPDRQFASEDLPYLAWGQRVPDVSLPVAHSDRTVDLRALDRPTLFTFFYSHCQTVCPVLIATLHTVQTHAIENGYGGGVRFRPVTFDPSRDDAERLREFATERNVALDAGNWQFLRPESPSRAETVVQERFGVSFERTGSDATEGYMFTHTPMTTLVNAGGYVERAYRTKSPDREEIIEDLRTVRGA
jgi:protein SCO1/2